MSSSGEAIMATMNGRSHFGKIPLLNLVAFGAILYPAWGQLQSRIDQADTKSSVAGTIEQARQDSPDSIYYVEQLGRAHAVEAIPMLEGKFARTKDPLDKAKVAQVLVKLGDNDNAYWDFLVKLATPALESDQPDFLSYDEFGKVGPGPSPAFIAWANVHNVAPNGPKGTAQEEAMYWFPAEVGLLALTGDPRAVPLLRRGLLSPNHMIEAVAAQGLAEMQDKESVPLIIDACKKAPAEAAGTIADSLVFFDDPAAQNAVDTYVPKDRAKALREARRQGKKTPWS